MKNNLKWIIPVGVIVLLILIIGGSYNGLISKKENVDSKYADISVQLERRADLIPNLVSTVKGYVKHEEKVIDSVTTARENLMNAKNVQEKANANDELTNAINNLLVVVENYPDLKANTNFINLQDELSGTENRIAVARKDYNDAVKSYNSEIKKFPKNIVAGLFNFETANYFEAKATSNEVPNVSFE